MFGNSTYLIWLALCIGLPLLALAALARVRLWRRRRALGWALMGALVGGWAWDVLAVRLGAWYYSPANIANIWIGGLPLEEWLWIVGVTLLFGCVTVLLAEHNAELIYHQDTKAPRQKQAENLHSSDSWCLGALVVIALNRAATAYPTTHFSHLAMLLIAGVIFHAILWARNAAFLWARRGVILRVVGIAELWMLLTDPLGGAWGAWYFDHTRVLGIWLFGLMPIEDLFGIAVVASAAASAVLVFGYSPRRWV